MIANNIDDELILLKNEEIYLKLLKEDLNKNETESFNQIKEFNLSVYNTNNNPFTENYLSISSDNNKEVNISLLNEVSLNRNSLDNDFKNICLETDIVNKKTNLSLKSENNKFNSKLKNNSMNNNLNVKSKLNVERGENTPNKTPNKIKSNFSFASKFTNSNLVKSSIQSKDTKKN